MGPGSGTTPPSEDAVQPITDTDLLQMLLAEVGRTRAELHSLRGHKGVSADTTASARWACLRALEEYAGALKARCWPIPRAIQQDINLHRSLCEAGPRPRSVPGT